MSIGTSHGVPAAQEVQLIIEPLASCGEAAQGMPILPTRYDRSEEGGERGDELGFVVARPSRRQEEVAAGHLATA